MLLTPNTLLQNRYLIVRLLGQGGFGAVYEARDQRLGHRVALKQLTLDDQDVPQALPAFEREARILARLKHAALPKVSDYFVDAKGYFLLMEYIEGDDFKVLLEQRSAPFPVSDVLEWADQLLDVLEYLHSRQPPVIHRDIKPANIKLSPEGKIYLLDFGIAKGGKINTYQARSGRSSIYAFSQHYASMEQIEGQGTDARSDLYSLGVTLHHLLTGVVPPQTISRVNAKAMNKADPLRPVNELNPLVPVEVARVLSQATEFDPNLRPQSARAMRDALEHAVSGQTPAPAPPPAPLFSTSTTSTIATQIDNAPSPDLATLPKWAIIVGVILLLLVGAVGGGILVNRFLATAAEESKATEVALMPTEAPEATEAPETETPPPTEAPAEVAAPIATATEIPAPTETATEIPIPTESATEIPAPIATAAEIPTEAAAAEPPTAIPTISFPTSTPLPPRAVISEGNVSELQEMASWNKEQVSEVAFSPDGELLAVGSWKRIYLYDAETLQSLEMKPFLESKAWSIAFSPDGKLLAAGSDRSVELWDISDRASQATLLRPLEGHTSSVWSVAFSPDGLKLASGSQDDTVRLWEVSNGTLLHTLEGHGNDVLSVAFFPDGRWLASGSGGSSGPLRLWNVSDGTLFQPLEGCRPQSVAFSPDGQWLASGCGGEVLLWEMSNDIRFFHTLDTDNVKSMAFSPDGRLLAFDSYQGVQLWKVSDRTLLHTLERHASSEVRSVVFSPDGRLLASGFRDGTIRLWGVEE